MKTNPTTIFLFAFFALGGCKKRRTGDTMRPPQRMVTVTGRTVIRLVSKGITLDGTGWYFNHQYFHPSGLSDASVLYTRDSMQREMIRSGVDALVVTDDDTLAYKAAIHRQTVVLTADSVAYIDGRSTGNDGSGGTALPGSFYYEQETPVFVCTRSLRYNVGDIIRVCMHEIGHSVGLKHTKNGNNDWMSNSPDSYGRDGWYSEGVENIAGEFVSEEDSLITAFNN
ncbi:MAG TPA: zinc-dependent metalloprotease family protein [Candidatus Paceibacterota bacterium]|nr:zinc-dependent metalloprotease family protein [Candidatus Paceibacterota bacterium]